MSTKRYTVFINLGTPSDTRLWTIRKYLFEFLFDPCVIDIPWLPRLLLVGGIIVPFRSYGTRKSYQEIFTPQGSPLMMHSKELVGKINDAYQRDKTNNEMSGYSVPIALLAMRYGKPSIKKIFTLLQADLQAGHHVEVVFVPLYPQAALSTTETVIRKIKSQNEYLQHFIKRYQIPSNRFWYNITTPFYNNPDYLKILAASIKPYWDDKSNGFEHILFSYHGIPERHLKKYSPKNYCLSEGDCCYQTGLVADEAHRTCYRHQVYVTTEKLVAAMGLSEADYSLGFQSRLGRSPWLTPYTDETIKELAKRGIKKLLVVCPAFVSDNLETLFEIQIENEELFKEHGGEELKLVPCLNSDPNWISFIKSYADSFHRNPVKPH